MSDFLSAIFIFWVTFCGYLGRALAAEQFKNHAPGGLGGAVVGLGWSDAVDMQHLAAIITLLIFSLF